MERVVAYIDGFNLYFGLKSKGWKRYCWLNVQLLAHNLLRPQQQLVGTKYFTARIANPEEDEYVPIVHNSVGERNTTRRRR